MFPLLETRRLRLRMIEPGDVTAVYEIFGDEDVTRYYGLETYTRIEQAAERITLYRQNFIKRRSLRWGITFKEEDWLLGTVGIMNWRPRFFNAALGYDLTKRHWRQGIMCEALTAVLDYAFTTMQMNRLEAFVMPQNKPSSQLLEKLGFQNEGLMREYGYWRGGFHDLELYSLLKGDWRTKF
ncbi:MAG: GNAT family N-acetyltransferase [Chloroflexi bacterium]|nr:GNAT family N-acetyltransferase [Chloroflexota bacterium]